MLPQIHLDTERFEEMTQEMRNMISSIYPAWTDHNAHDPGITLMELFAWLKEILQYRMDQVDDGQMEQYLMLLGMSRQKRRAARTILQLSCEDPVRIKKNSRFFAGDLCFEAEWGLELSGVRVELCACEEKGQLTVLDNPQLLRDGQMHFKLFGHGLHPGTVFYLGLNAPLKPGQATPLFIRIGKDWPVKRNKIGGDMLPLADLAYGYYEEETAAWQPLTVIRDESFGFLQEGFLVVSSPRPMGLVKIGDRLTYGLRIVLNDSGYEVPPVLTGIGLGYVPAVQRYTRARIVPGEIRREEDGQLQIVAGEELTDGELAECCLCFGEHYQIVDAQMQIQGDTCVFVPADPGRTPDGACILAYEAGFASGRRLPDGDGFPAQKIRLQDKALLTESFLLLAEDPEAPGFFELWQQVPDFHTSGPEDAHYVLDGETGELLFGDGFCGRMPEGRLLIAGCAVSAGKAGNIKAASFKAPGYPHLTAVSLEDAEGGRDLESFEAAFRRYLKTQDDIFQAVTLSDYEDLAMRTPGLMLRSCRAISSGRGQVTVAVMPFSEDGAGVLSQRAARNIQAFLEKRRMIGTRVLVRSAAYIALSVTAQLYLKPQYRDGQQLAEAAIWTYFQEIYGRMGETLSYRDLCGRLERLPCLERIGYLTIEARGNGFTYGENGDILPPPDGVFFLKELECAAIER